MNRAHPTNAQFTTDTSVGSGSVAPATQRVRGDANIDLYTTELPAMGAGSLQLEEGRTQEDMEEETRSEQHAGVLHEQSRRRQKREALPQNC